MKVLFIVQGEGRGHLTQAIAMEGLLHRNGHDVVEVLVGKSNSRRLPGFFNRNIQAPIKRFLSPNFLPTSMNKRAGLLRSVAYNILRMPVYIESIHYINKRIAESGAELVINFYELLTGLTYWLYRPAVPQISIGHQYLFLHHDFKFPEKNSFELFLLRFFTRLTCIGAKEKLALSFQEMKDDNKQHICVIPPLLRQDILTYEGACGDYIHGYMVNAGFCEDVKTWHKAFPKIPLHFFWDKPDEEETCRIDETLSFHQINDVEFLRYLAGCKAYATTAGFESVCEAMYLGKPLLMVPAHIEQDCNAYDAACVGAGIIADSFNLELLLEFSKSYRPNLSFRNWVNSCDRKIMHNISSVISVSCSSFSSPMPSVAIS